MNRRTRRRQERVAKRRTFRVAVSGNRKWIAIGLAIVAVCVTLIFLVIKFPIL